MQPAPDSLLSTTDLIARQAIELQKHREDLVALRSKVFDARRKAALRFESDHAHSIKDFDFQYGSLVLMCNTAVKKVLNRKMHPRYLDPLVVLTRNRDGAYVLCELDGSVFGWPVAAFRLVPYFARRSIPLPEDFLDISLARYDEMKRSMSQGDNASDPGDLASDSDEHELELMDNCLDLPNV